MAWALICRAYKTNQSPCQQAQATLLSIRSHGDLEQVSYMMKGTVMALKRSRMQALALAGLRPSDQCAPSANAFTRLKAML